MSVKYPSHLYIRIDRPLRADLLSAAEAAGQSVSAFARALLRGSITQGAKAISISKSDTAEPLTFRATISQSPDQGER